MRAAQAKSELEAKRIAKEAQKKLEAEREKAAIEHYKSRTDAKAKVILNFC